MKNPTFQEQYNKITNAYYKDELNPWSSCACFIGNMLNNKYEWLFIRHPSSLDKAIKYGKYYSLIDSSIKTSYVNNFLKGEECIKKESNGYYTIEEIFDLEDNFLTICGIGIPIEEEILYEAMESTLLMLRKIHESKGEIIQDYNFAKRELVKS